MQTEDPKKPKPKPKPVVKETKNIELTFKYDKGSTKRGTDYIKSTDIKTIYTPREDGRTINVATVTTTNTTTVDKNGKIGSTTLNEVKTTSADKMFGGGTTIPGTFSASESTQTLNSNPDKDLASLTNQIAAIKSNDPNNDSPLQVSADKINNVKTGVGFILTVGAAADLIGGTKVFGSGTFLNLGIAAGLFPPISPEILSSNTNIK